MTTVTVCAVAVSAVLLICVAGCGTASAVLWQEAEAYAAAPRPTQDRAVDGRDPASGGKAARMEGLGQAVELHVFPAYGHGYRAEEYMTLTLEFFGKHRRTKG